MGQVSTPMPVKLIVGMIAGDVELFEQSAEKLAELFGQIDLVSEDFNFDFTHYYDEEMGRGLIRRFASFERLIMPDEIARIKCQCNDIEQTFAVEGNRRVNLDPGYISESKLVLASTKDFAHRIYLGSGIYAEITLSFVRGKWVSHPYTFPDYASGIYNEFFTRVRKTLRAQLGRKGHHK